MGVNMRVNTGVNMVLYMVVTKGVHGCKYGYKHQCTNEC